MKLSGAQSKFLLRISTGCKYLPTNTLEGQEASSAAMEKKTPEQINMELPPYSLFSKPAEPRKKCIAAIVIGLLLSGIVAAAITIPIYMLERNTEKMVEMIYSAGNGENIRQTVYIQNRQSIVAIFIKADTYSTSVLLDYNQKVIGIRTLNTCYLLRMDETTTPSKKELLRRVEYYQANNSTLGKSFTLSFVSAREANPVDLGISINLLCSNAAIYWAKGVKMEQRIQKPVIIIIIK